MAPPEYVRVFAFHLVSGGDGASGALPRSGRLWAIRIAPSEYGRVFESLPNFTRHRPKQIKKPPEGGFFICFWRRRWDSNPRYRYKPYASLAGMCLRPLGHVSILLLQIATSEDRDNTGSVVLRSMEPSKKIEKSTLSRARRPCAGRVRPTPCISRRSAPKS
jgi:hypothetical protein